jgi:heme/copper-type cytochrome/quinol oxidase subunit 2
MNKTTKTKNLMMRIKQELIDAIDGLYYQFYKRNSPSGAADKFVHAHASVMLVVSASGPFFLLVTRIAMWTHYMITKNGFILLGIVLALILLYCIWYFRIRNDKHIEICSNHEKFSQKKYIVIFYANLFLLGFTLYYGASSYGSYTSHYTHPEIWK